MIAFCASLRADRAVLFTLDGSFDGRDAKCRKSFLEARFSWDISKMRLRLGFANPNNF
jgi:hypothetical protein